MKRCKITILQRTLNEKLAREYAAPGFTKCPMMREGQVFYADYAKPEGFCDEAWKAVYQYVFALSHGAGKFYFGDWITKEGVAICSCNDGLRPVIMKIERTRGLLDLLRTGGVISEVRAERVRIFQNGAADSTPAAPFLILRPNSPTLLRYSLRLGSMQFPALRPALPERLRGWVVLRGRSSHPADSPPIRRDNTTLTRKMRRVLPEAT